MGLNETARGQQLHIGIFGVRNSGKSSLINTITNQNISLVSDYAGTTTDPVYKPMELNPIGPVVFIDTAGFDDQGDLGKLRVEKTKQAAQKTDIAIILLNHKGDFSLEKQWIDIFKKSKIPYILLINKSDLLSKKEINNLKEKANELFKSIPIVTSMVENVGVDQLKEKISLLVPQEFENLSITGSLVKEDDIVLLVMPQDIQAPKGRLILPQVQTIRELLDKKCIVVSTVVEKMEQALKAISKSPRLIITDSQVFKLVYEKKPKDSLLTSFSVLFAALKGDIEYFINGAKEIEKLTELSNVLIAEACTHAPLSEDIGREKIPNMLRKKFGEKINIKIVSGVDFP
ncbi:MAG: [FeFe] hydrogenase H-cluster maturation GTPase HydF, partial [Oscillospiraceae bacterium]